MKRALNAPVVSAVTKQVVNADSKRALKLRDAGKLQEAKNVLKASAAYSRSQGALLGGVAEQELNDFSDEVSIDADNIVKKEDWNANRKSLKAKQFRSDKQQSYK